jgi:hypothetical protein|tara:strand:+ start:392 stop:589 length:198 start_codon:yes stop_codon:yes gene_type:complete
MIEIIYSIMGLLIIVVGVMVLWESSVMLSERNKLRKITGAYYDFEITEALKEMGMSREEALNLDV